MNDNYLDLLKSIFLSLMNNNLKISENWLSDHILRFDNYSGGIEELTTKIANIRTWTYIANQSLWLENNELTLNGPKGENKRDFNNPLIKIIYQISNPILNPVRNIIPPIGGLDISPIIVIFIIQIILL